MTGLFIACTAALALIVVGLLIWSANAEARRERVITTVCASVLIVLLAAAPSLYYNISSERVGRSEDSAIKIQMQSGASGDVGTVPGTNIETSEQEEKAMEKQNASAQIQRALGIIEGVSWLAERNVGEALGQAVELIEEVIGADGGSPEAADAAADENDLVVQSGVWYDTERYLPPEDGWYIGYIVGYDYSMPVRYYFGTQTFENTDKNKVGVVRWAHLPE